MDEDRNAFDQPRRTWRWWAARALLALLVLVLIFHRPVLFRIARSYADSYAAKANLKIDCTLEGSIFTSIAIRNLHVTPIKKGGTTLKDFSKSDGTPGYFSIELQVYGKAGHACPRCENKLELIRIGQRSTVFCPACQPMI